jgi:UDP-N-acetyl-D-mannosaminuronic acid dehydrogenase
MPDCASRDFILAARRFNESMEDIVVKWVEENVGRAEDGTTLALSGMAFKGSPVTSDLRGSSSVYLARKLKAKGYRLHLHDFAAIPDEMRELDLGQVFADLYDSCAEADALLVLNNNPRYANVISSPVLLRKGFKVLDVWRVCTELNHDREIDISTLGNLECPKA